MDHLGTSSANNSQSINSREGLGNEKPSQLAVQVQLDAQVAQYQVQSVVGRRQQQITQLAQHRQRQIALNQGMNNARQMARQPVQATQQ